MADVEAARVVFRSKALHSALAAFRSQVEVIIFAMLRPLKQGARLQNCCVKSWVVDLVSGSIGSKAVQDSRA